MIAICFSTLLPIFSNWSLESIVRSIRSAISLRSVGPGHKSPLTAIGIVARSESETAITGPQRPGLKYCDQGSLDVEIHTVSEIAGKKAPNDPGIMKETQVLRDCLRRLAFF